MLKTFSEKILQIQKKFLPLPSQKQKNLIEGFYGEIAQLVRASDS